MMLPYEKGVLPSSELFESTPSRQAQNVLFYLQRAGHFFCDQAYLVSREQLPSFLLVHILSGRLEVVNRGEKKTAAAGDFGLIDCYQPHSYRAAEPLEYIWIHFDGSNTRAFYEAILQANGVVFAAAPYSRLPEKCLLLIDQLRCVGSVAETTASRRLHDILCDLLYTADGHEAEDPVIAAAQQYISQHMRETLPVAQIAKQCSISPSHFSRLFKKQTGHTPHEYLTNLRINKAKTLLKETQLSVAQIAEELGYDYDTSFTSAFRHKVGLSPRRFRNMPV